MKPSVISFIVVVLAAVIGFFAYSSYLTRTHHIIQTPPPVSVQEHGTVGGPPPGQRVQPAKVYRVGVEHDEEVLREVDIKVNADHPVESTLIALFTLKMGNLANPIPEGTKLIGLKVKKGVATINLNKAFVDNFNGGSEAESLVIESILKTLSQFPNIKKARLLVEGNPIDTLGHLDLSGPLDVRSTGVKAGEEE